MKFRQINNLTIYRNADGFCVVKSPDGETLYTTAYVVTAVHWCKACTAYLKPKTQAHTVVKSAGGVAVLRGGTELSPELILCKNVADARRVINADVRENVAAGDTLIKNVLDLAEYGTLSDVLDSIQCATVNNSGQIQWWRIIDKDEIHSSSEYK